MKFLTFALCLMCLPLLAIQAHAEVIVPTKTWDPASKPTVQPFNLKSILRNGVKPQPKARGPQSRNSIEILKEGGELPISQALKNDVDYNPLRDAIRRTDRFRGLNAQQTETILADVRAREEDNMQKQLARRNEFYIRHGMSDEHTREFLRSKQGKLVQRSVNKEEREKKRTEKQRKELASARQKEEPAGYQPFKKPAQEEKSTYKSSVIVPTAQPKQGEKTVKPFFYR